MKRIAPWMVSATVHAALLAAALWTTVHTPPPPEPSGPEFHAEASYSIVIRPGGGAKLGDLAAADDRQFGAPENAPSEEITHGQDPLEGVPEWKPTTEGSGLVGSSLPSAPRPPGGSFRKGSVVRLDVPRGGGGNLNGRGTAGAGTGTGRGVGEGADDGVEAVLVSASRPEFPETARRSNQEGTVILKFRIDEEGIVRAVVIDTSSGHAVLDEAARAAVLTWRYRPATLRGVAVSSERIVRLVFRLE